ncbi:MAG TPA: pyruvate kinase [Thermoplasmata archaeon]|nr:pyruvate kinase [Thermoplasmata archaeon]
MRKTKILATVGPASDRPARLRELLRAGTDGFRLNFSHGTDAEHRATLRRMREAARQAGRDVAIVADVQGPKIRIGALAAPAISLEPGQSLRLDADSRPGDGRRVGVQLPSFVRAARPGDPVLLGDGVVELRVERVRRGAIETRVISGGTVSGHAGIYLPRAHLRVEVFGPKDRHDAQIGLRGGTDFVALSFVRDASDVVRARRWLDHQAGGREVGLIAKIERRDALDEIDGILSAADGIMVARGDLGIEVPLERLALEQKRLVRKANVAGKFVIVATQMLLSMIHSPRPTRAEATDVANAVLDGADAVMLSEESAVGEFPVEAVRWLARIAEATEPAYDARGLRELLRATPPGAPSERSVAAAAVTLAEGVRARAIATPTHSGRTARTVAALRPTAPVVALSHSAPARRRLALVRGVRTLPVPAHRNLIELRDHVAALVDSTSFAGPGPIVLTAGYPVEGRPTNLVTLVD